MIGQARTRTQIETGNQKKSYTESSEPVSGHCRPQPNGSEGGADSQQRPEELEQSIPGHTPDPVIGMVDEELGGEQEKQRQESRAAQHDHHRVTGCDSH